MAVEPTVVEPAAAPAQAQADDDGWVRAESQQASAQPVEAEVKPAAAKADAAQGAGQGGTPVTHQLPPADEPVAPPEGKKSGGGWFKWVLILGLLIGGAYYLFKPNPIEAKAKEVRVLIEKGRLDQAQTELRELTAMKAETAVIKPLRDSLDDARRKSAKLAAEARLALNRKQYEQANKLVEQAVNLNVNNAEAARVSQDLNKELQRVLAAEKAAAERRAAQEAAAKEAAEREAQQASQKPADVVPAKPAVVVPPSAGPQAVPHTPSSQPAAPPSVSRPPSAGGGAQPEPAPAARPASPAPVTESKPVVDPKVIECETMVKAGRRALQNKAYDQAIANANDAMAVLPGCYGAAQLRDAAQREKRRAQEGVVIE